jgi:hypothetical protein
MDAPQEEFYSEGKTEDLAVLFRIISSRSWDELQNLHEALSESRVERVLHGIYALICEPGGARRIEAWGRWSSSSTG